MKRALVLGFATWVLALVAGLPLSAQVTMTSPANKHNLSTTGPGPVKTAATTEICIFCHTPHNSNVVTPLWNQAMSSAPYTAYSSSTMAATVGVPQGSSKLCLSCHDGTVAIGNTASAGQITMQGVTGGRLTGASSLGTSLGDDHPISFVPVTGSQIVNPPNGSPLALDANGQVQCRTCHEPHQMDIDPTTNKFLAVNNSASAMCLVCHQQKYWSSNPSTHMTSTKAFTAAQGAHTGYTTVATNGCESCHKPHTAGTAARTLKAVEEANCTTCHGPSLIGKNIQAEYQKTYRHPTYSTTPSVHDEAESPTNPAHTLPEVSAAAARHAECEDCHNPHASYVEATTTAPPKATGKMAGVWGITRTGTVALPSGTPPSVNEYEICFKCHGDSANLPQSGGQPAPPYPMRQAVQFNKRLQFDTTAVSYHPIETAAPTIASGFSLITPQAWLNQGLTMTKTSTIRCNDCHDNDTGPNAPTPGTGPSGTHGSNYKQLLVARFDIDPAQIIASSATYALCYKCHDQTKVLSSSSWTEHQRHIVTARASCSVCHDPHGISASQGTATNNAHLINFDTRSAVQRNSATPLPLVAPLNGVLNYTRTGTNRGSCTLVCHDSDGAPFTHNNQVYPN